MLEAFFLTVNSWMAGAGPLVGLGCFVWGAVSVLFSPCHMAAIPLIIAYVGGQQKILAPRVAGVYAAAFTTGLFITILIIGIACALLGRMLGDVGVYWQIPIGLILVWVALGMLGVERCTLSGSLQRFNLKGLPGAFLLGLAYGLLSGSCTFGFIAPILAIITLQGKVAAGTLLIFLFAAGHCLPIAVAGSSAAGVRRLAENTRWQHAGTFFRKGAGFVIGLLGLYFILTPFCRA